MEIKKLYIIAFLLLISKPSFGETVTAWSFGSGNSSCASWTMQNPLENLQIEEWILGFWTGMNAANQMDHSVGSKTDSYGVIGEVENICNSNPSEIILNAANEAYLKMMKNNR